MNTTEKCESYHDDHKTLLAKNTLWSIVLQVTTILAGLVLPRQVLKYYGSEVNGLVNSITQFLSVITFLEFGVGAVVQSALYKPLAERNIQKVSEIIASATRFFRKLGKIFLVYVVFLLFIYPQISEQDFGWLYSAALIVIICISQFAQYYYGMVDGLLLSADQHGYIQYSIQSITLVLNTVACLIAIRCGVSVHAMKILTSAIYLARPLLLRLYVQRHYQLNRHIQYKGEPLQQKWNGVAQHVAAIVLDSTDVIVLTIFSTLSNVSIYSIYHFVVAGISQLLMALNNGVRALIGELLAKNKMPQLNKIFGVYEWAMHTASTFFFGCAGILILPFVRIYTTSINDAEYIQPLFALIIILAFLFYSYRNPYIIMILAAGHYKQTQSNYIIAAVLNIVISIASVRQWGLVGVAIGTLVAMAYQTVWMAYYNSRHLLHWPFKNFCRQLLADALTVLLAVPVCLQLPLSAANYGQWVLRAIPVALVWLCSAVIVNLVFYKEKVFKLFQNARHILPARKG